MLSVENIGFSYQDDKTVFSEVNFRLKPGEIISIVGPSGAGKSSLVKCLAGLLQLSEGVIRLNGEVLKGPEDQLIAGHPEIALVRQLFELERHFTVEENLSNQMHHLPQKVRLKFVDELLDVFGLSEIRHQKSRFISGGEQQRLTTACALAKEPQLLLLDEPFVHLDVHLTKSIGQYIRKLAEIRGMGVVLVTHEGAEALSWATKILMMRNGKITSSYTPESAYFRPKNLFEGRFFGELNSIYFEGKQYLFRPNEYALTAPKSAIKIDVIWKYSLFKGSYYANYFNLVNGKEIVLYANTELTDIHQIYVGKE